MSRPFGVSLLIAGYDKKKGPQLFFSDPSGTYFQYKAKAIGAGSEGAQVTLQEKYNELLTTTEAIDLSVSILKQVMEEKITKNNIDIAIVTKEKGFYLCKEDELEEFISRIPQN